MKKNLTLPLIVGAVSLVVGLAGGYYFRNYQIGEQRQEFGRGNITSGNFARNGQTSQSGQRGGGFRPITGQILSIDDKGITVKLNDGSSKIVIVSDTTLYNKTEEATKTDFKVGDNVSVFGTDNSDGSVTAQSVSSGNNFMRQSPMPQSK